MKRIFLVLLILLTLVGTISAQATGEKGVTESGFKEMKIKLGHALEVSHHNHMAALYFADLVKEKTRGKVTVEVYPASQLGDEGDMNDAMVFGTQELGLFGIAEAAKRDPALSLFDSAYVFENRDHLIKVFESDIFFEMAEEAAAKSGIRPLSGTYYGTRHLTTGKVAVRRIEDMTGLKIRCPDAEVFLTVIKALGAQPSPLSFSEVYLALQQGVMDGQENPFATIEAMKFYEVQKYLTMTGHIVNGDFFMASEKWFKSITPELQKVIQDSAIEAAAYINPISFGREDASREFLSKAGLTIIELSPAEYKKFQDAGKSTHAAMIEKWGGRARYEAILALGK